MRVAFLSEGATELAFAPGTREDEAWRHDLLLKILLERILGIEGRLEPFEDARLPFLLGNPAGKLCRQAARLIRDCVRSGAEAAVVVVDRDRTESRKRLDALRQQREDLRTGRGKPLWIPMAVGVAVETVEAWLLADELCLCDVLGLPHPDQPIGSPEKLNGHPGEPRHPKYVLNGYFNRDVRPERGFRDRVLAVAQRMNLDMVAERCPQGFARFREDVLREFGPLFGRP
jgi:hypothetical protein